MSSELLIYTSGFLCPFSANGATKRKETPNYVYGMLFMGKLSSDLLINLCYLERLLFVLLFLFCLTRINNVFRKMRFYTPTTCCKEATIETVHLIHVAALL